MNSSGRAMHFKLHVVFWIRKTEKLCRKLDFVSTLASCPLCVQS